MEKLKEGDVVYICPWGHGSVSKYPFVCSGPHPRVKGTKLEYSPFNSIKVVVDKVPK